ncbi:unnamed protein product [Closterium sp. NIES-54]
MNSELASWRSTGMYVDAVPPPRANVVDGMWLFKVKQPPGSPPVFKARYVARGFIYGLRQLPSEWHDTLRSTLRDLGFRPSSADPSLFVRVGSTPFFKLVYVDDLVFATPDKAALAEVLQRFRLQFSTTLPTPLAVDHRLTGPFLDEPFEPCGPYSELVGCLIELTSLCDSSYADDVETQRLTQGYSFSMGAGAVSWRATRSSSVASSSAEAEIYAGAIAAQELRWLTFLLADLGERTHTALTLFADNKAMILLCCKPRLETRVKHIDVRYFLLRELQRRGQVQLDLMASEGNTADLFTKALAPGDHHRICVQLGLVEAGPRLL